MNVEQLYFIRWRSRATGATGGGTRAFPRHDAERYARELNREHPSLVHWVEPEPEGGLN